MDAPVDLTVSVRLSSPLALRPAPGAEEAGRAEPHLRDLEALAFAQQHVLGADLQAVELQLAMAAVLLGSHDRDTAQDAPAGLVAVEEEGGQAVARIVGGTGEQNEVGRLAGTRDVPFAPMDAVAPVRPALGAGLDHGWVGAAAGMRLGHGNGRADLAANDRLSQRSFCSGVPMRSSTCMLPSSGAAALNTTGPKIERFMAS